MGAACFKTTTYFMDIKELSAEDVEALQEAQLAKDSKVYEFPWQVPYTLDYIESLAPVRILGVGLDGFVQLMKHKKRKNEDGSPQYLAVKSVYKSCVQAIKFTRERDMLVECQDLPFIVKYRGCAQTDRMAFIAMDYQPGNTLLQVLQQREAGYLDEDEVKFYMAELVVMLRGIHAKNIILRDLKLEDVCVDREGHLALVDFSCSIRATRDGRAYSSVPARTSSAPELLHRDSNLNGYTNSVDWWSMGCMAYHLLTGQRPFGVSLASSPYAIYTAIRATQKQALPVPWLRLTADCRDFVRRLLNPALTRRLKTPAGIMEHSWFFGVDWEAVSWRALDVPHVPLQVSSEDFRYFPPIAPEQVEEAAFLASLRLQQIKQAVARDKMTTEQYRALLRNKRAMNKVFAAKVDKHVDARLRAEQADENAALWVDFALDAGYSTGAARRGRGGVGAAPVRKLGQPRGPEAARLNYDEPGTVKDTTGFEED